MEKDLQMYRKRERVESEGEGNQDHGLEVQKLRKI